MGTIWIAVEEDLPMDLNWNLLTRWGFVKPNTIKKYKVVLTVESVDEILKYNHLN